MPLVNQVKNLSEWTPQQCSRIPQEKTIHAQSSRAANQRQ